MDQQTTKKIRIFKNGDDQYAGKNFVCNYRTAKTWNAFLDNVANEVEAAGPVRGICTPVNGTPVTNLDDINDKFNYVALGKAPFKPLNYEALQELANHKFNSSPRKPVSTSDSVMKYRDRYKEMAVGRIKDIQTDSIVIFIYMNGEPQENPLRTIIQKKSLEDHDAVLNEINHRIKMKGKQAKSVHTTGGRKLTRGGDFENAASYVVVPSSDFRGFVKAEYGCVGKPKFFVPFKSNGKTTLNPWKSTEYINVRTQHKLHGKASSYTGGSSASGLDTDTDVQGRNSLPRLKDFQGRKKLNYSQQKEREDLFHANSKPVKQNVKQIDLDKDEGGLFKVRKNRDETKGAAQVNETKSLRKPQHQQDIQEEIDGYEDENAHKYTNQNLKKSKNFDNDPKRQDNTRGKGATKPAVLASVKNRIDSESELDEHEGGYSKKVLTKDHKETSVKRNKSSDEDGEDGVTIKKKEIQSNSTEKEQEKKDGKMESDCSSDEGNTKRGRFKDDDKPIGKESSNNKAKSTNKKVVEGAGEKKQTNSTTVKPHDSVKSVEAGNKKKLEIPRGVGDDLNQSTELKTKKIVKRIKKEGRDSSTDADDSSDNDAHAADKTKMKKKTSSKADELRKESKIQKMSTPTKKTDDDDVKKLSRTAKHDTDDSDDDEMKMSKRTGQKMKNSHSDDEDDDKKEGGKLMKQLKNVKTINGHEDTEPLDRKIKKSENNLDSKMDNRHDKNSQNKKKAIKADHSDSGSDSDHMKSSKSAVDHSKSDSDSENKRSRKVNTNSIKNHAQIDSDDEGKKLETVKPKHASQKSKNVRDDDDDDQLRKPADKMMPDDRDKGGREGVATFGGRKLKLAMDVNRSPSPDM